MEIRKGTLKDLEAIAAVEAACFPAAEAATATEAAITEAEAATTTTAAPLQAKAPSPTEPPARIPRAHPSTAKSR